jgi:hypothetical protein
MSFNFNEDLTDSQLLLKEQLTREILRDYTKAQPRRGEAVSKIPVHSSIEDFIDGVKELIDIDQETTGQRVILKDDYTTTNIMEDPDNPNQELSGVVLYSMKRRAPGTMEGGNTWFDRGRREVKSRIREIIANDPCNPGQAKIVYSQWFDNEVKFDITARTNKRANELALWFENLMESNRPFFAFRGITKYFMNIREADEFKQLGNGSYECRPYYYFVRTEKCHEVTEQALNRLIIRLNTDTE